MHTEQAKPIVAQPSLFNTPPEPEQAEPAPMHPSPPTGRERIRTFYGVRFVDDGLTLRLCKGTPERAE